LILPSRINHISKQEIVREEEMEHKAQPPDRPLVGLNENNAKFDYIAEHVASVQVRLKSPAKYQNNSQHFKD
jgi:hypothetical protein